MDDSNLDVHKKLGVVSKSRRKSNKIAQQDCEATKENRNYCVHYRKQNRDLFLSWGPTSLRYITGLVYDASASLSIVS